MIHFIYYIVVHMIYYILYNYNLILFFNNLEYFTKRDIVASLTYIHHMKKVDLLSPTFNNYNDFIYKNINMFRSNISTLVHR